VSRYNRSTSSGIAFPEWTRAVKILVFACVITWFVQHVAGRSFTDQFGLTPSDVIQRLKLWQLASYIFLHATGNITHLLFNMLGLWMFGSDLEREWGTRQFTKYFFICGIGAGIVSVLLDPNSIVPTIGASASIYGVLLAFGMLFPNRIIILIVFPIPAKYLVMIVGGIAFFSSLSAGSGSGVAHIAHLAGMAIGFVYLQIRGKHRRSSRASVNPIGGLKAWYAQRKRARLRKKFEVYYNEKRDEDDKEKWRRWKN
jgi:membrane associated rhomboid family serine protease